MCGLAGACGTRLASLKPALSIMVNQQAHRGPDGEGTHWAHWGDIHLGLGHTRLAIQDVSATGDQPMISADTGSVLIFNGEIYNSPALRQELSRGGQQFKGTSDTEVLLYALEAWGTECISRLEGMFAFAWLDQKQQCLILARDPLGIKPLYTSYRDNQLLFASEVRSLLGTGLISAELDQQGLLSMLAYGTVQAPWTLHRDIRAFPAGHWQRIDLSNGRYPEPAPPVRHWQPAALVQDIGHAEAVELTRHRVGCAVTSHLLSDVPVGVFLSSGIDSSLVTALAAGQRPDLTAFTVGFRDQADFNEADVAAKTAARINIDHQVLWLEQNEALSAVEPWLNQLDQPSMDGLNTYVISRLVREAGVKVVLSGQGGDELFGGYPSFFDVPRLMKWLRVLGPLPAGTRARMASLLAVGRGDVFRHKLQDAFRTGADPVSLALLRRRSFSDRQLDGLMTRAVPGDLRRHHFMADNELSIDEPEKDLLRTVSLVEMLSYLRHTLLSVGDNASMAHGLELRVPFLDRPLLDLACQLPGKAKIPDGKTPKALLRSAFPEQLPPELLNLPKKGFVIPVNRWMPGSLRALCESNLSAVKAHELFQPAAVDTLWQSFLAAPDSPLWSRVWSLVVLGHYLRTL